MTNVSEWSTSPGSNNLAPPDGWPENMLPGKVNDCAREMMAALAKWYKDQSALLTTAGAGNAYTLTTNSVYTSLNDICLLTFLVHAANTGAATLNVDGLGAKPLRSDSNLGDFTSGQIVAGQTMVVVYNSGTDDFEVVGPSPAEAAATAIIPAGTIMLFVQTAAPTGWTKSVTHNNKALRLVSGAASTGGTTAFTSVFTSRTVGLVNLPVTNLSTASLTGSVSTTITNGTNVNRGGSSVNMDDAGSGTNVLDNVSTDTISLASGTVTFGGTLPLGGSGTAMDFAVQFVDVIMATKD